MNGVVVGAVAGCVAITTAVTALLYPRLVRKRVGTDMTATSESGETVVVRGREFGMLTVVIADDGPHVSHPTNEFHGESTNAAGDPIEPAVESVPTYGEVLAALATEVPPVSVGWFSRIVARLRRVEGAAAGAEAGVLPPTATVVEAERGEGRAGLEEAAFAVRYGENGLDVAPRRRWSWPALTLPSWRGGKGRGSDAEHLDVPELDADEFVESARVVPREAVAFASTELSANDVTLALTPASTSGDEAPAVAEPVDGQVQDLFERNADMRLVQLRHNEPGKGTPPNNRTAASSDLAAAGNDARDVAADAPLRVAPIDRPVTVEPATGVVAGADAVDVHVADGEAAVDEHHLMVEADSAIDDVADTPAPAATSNLDYSLSLITLQLRDANRWQTIKDEPQEVVLSAVELAAADARLAEIAETPVFAEKPNVTGGIVPGWAAEYAEVGVDVSEAGRIRLIDGYGLLTDESLFEILGRVFLTDESAIVRTAALMLLSERPLVELASAAIDCANHADPGERCAAVAALTALRESDALLSLLADEDAVLVKAAVVGLVGVVGPEETRRLVESVEGQHRDEALALVAFA